MNLVRLLCRWRVLFTVCLGLSLTAPQSYAQSTDTYTMMAVGEYHVCALRTDSTVACWGYNPTGGATPPSGTFTTISVGDLYSCGIHTSGSVECWGTPRVDPDLGIDDDYGQANPPTGNFTAISAGRFAACGIRSDQTLACWGMDAAGLIDPPTGAFLQVSMSYNHGCALHEDMSIACWGENTNGQTDAPNGEFAQVTTGGVQSCGLTTDGQIICWGAKYFGSGALPSGSYTAIATTGNTTCGIRQLGGIVCQGYNGPDLSPPYGVTDSMLGTYTQLGMASSYKCALLSDQTISCTGISDYYTVPAIQVQRETVTPEPAKSVQVVQAADESIAFRFTAAGGTAGYTFQVYAGSLPPGLTLNADGSVTGTATNTSARYADIEGIDTEGRSGVQRFWFNAYTRYLPNISR